MQDLNRRNILAAGSAMVLGAYANLPPAHANAQGTQTMAFDPKPLPFDPEKVPGLSAKLLTSHHDNNYIGAVKRLNAITASLKSLDWSNAANFTINGLKREELVAANSMILHELYFANLGPSGSADGVLAKALTRDFGSVEAWRNEFAATGKALGGGSGWVLLSYSPRENRLVNTWAAEHTMTLAGSTPILALDMYEHAYHIDYGAKAAAYVDAFMAAINWTNVAALYQSTTK